MEGNQYDVGFHPNQNTEPSAIIRAKPVPHQTWEISEDKRTATYIGPTVEAGYGPPIPPAVFVKGFTRAEAQPRNSKELNAALDKLKKLQDLANSFDTYKTKVKVTFHNQENLLEVINDIEDIK